MRNRLLTASVVVATAATMLTPGAATAAPRCAGADDAPRASTIVQARRATICLVNHERARRNLPRLREREQLRQAATRYARDMVARRFFAHVSPTGSTMIDRVRRTSYLDGARGWALGENLAWGSHESATPAEIVDGWMNSPGHRANILSRRFRDIGIGVALGAPSTQGVPDAATYVSEFGLRR